MELGQKDATSPTSIQVKCSVLVSRFAHWVNEEASPKTFLGEWVLLLKEILPPGQQLISIVSNTMYIFSNNILRKTM